MKKTYRFATLDEILVDFGISIKKNRLDRNQTQKEFTKSNGISVNQLSVIERTGNTSMITLVKFLKKLDKIDEFMNILEVNEDFNPYKNPLPKIKYRVKHSTKL